jgi:hypothetical protein
MTEKPEEEGEREVSSEGTDIHKSYEEESLKRLREATRRFLEP